jgi:hypothetical protein
MTNYNLPVEYSKLAPKQRREVREQYIKQQDNKCMFCGESLDGSPPDHITQRKINWRIFPPNFLKYPVHLQHDHDTNLTEGAVHAYCNAVMWQYHGR